MSWQQASPNSSATTVAASALTIDWIELCALDRGD
jgi:hypothetical protein